MTGEARQQKCTGPVLCTTSTHIHVDTIMYFFFFGKYTSTLSPTLNVEGEGFRLASSRCLAAFLALEVCEGVDRRVQVQLEVEFVQVGPYRQHP